MKTIGVEQTTLDSCLREAQSDRLVITRNGLPVALVVGVEGLDAEQIQLGMSGSFWQQIEERRGRKGISREELDRRLDQQAIE